MGNFQQHMTCSTVTGVVYGGAAFALGFHAPSCVLAAGLCSVAGMLPDIDSDTSRSFQECIYFAAGIGGIMAIQFCRKFGVDPEITMLVAAFAFFFIRFGVGEIVQKITIHRGLFHSIPAAVLAGEIVFFLSTGDLYVRFLKGAALTCGYLSHLILDEVYSIEVKNGVHVKKSFGTALKFYNSKKLGSSMLLYMSLVLVGALGTEMSGGFDSYSGQLVAETGSNGQSENFQQAKGAIVAFIEKWIPKNTPQTEPQTDITMTNPGNIVAAGASLTPLSPLSPVIAESAKPVVTFIEHIDEHHSFGVNHQEDEAELVPIRLVSENRFALPAVQERPRPAEIIFD